MSNDYCPQWQDFDFSVAALGYAIVDGCSGSSAAAPNRSGLLLGAGAITVCRSTKIAPSADADAAP